MYFVPATPSFRDVVINEIFADPTPQLGLPAADFIELYNASDSIFDLNGWVFSDAAASEALGSYILFPGEYVVIADDNYTFRFLCLSQRSICCIISSIEHILVMT